MIAQHLLRGPIVKRLTILFLATGLIPIVLVVLLPTFYYQSTTDTPIPESMMALWLVQGLLILFIVLLGATITLNQIAIPTQELVKGARAIADGELAYRVPVRRGDNEMITLCQRFNAMAEAVEVMRDSIEQQRASLQETLTQREDEFAAILDIARLVNHQTDLTSMVEQALAIAHPALGSDIVNLALLDESNRITSIVSSCKDCQQAQYTAHCEDCSQRNQLRRTLYSMQDNLIKTAIEDRQYVVVSDTRLPENPLDETVLQYLDALGMHKLTVRPIISHERVLGVLVLMRHRVDPISLQTRMLLDAMTQNIAVLIDNWHLKNRVHELTIVEERRRLASELHDSVTQSLFTLSLTAKGLKSSLDHIPAVNQQALEMLVEQTKVVQAEMRTLINELRPVNLEHNDLESALRQHILSFRRAADTEITLTIRGGVRHIPEPVQQNLNRIAQEALSNIIRHAQASHASVCLETDESVATLTITDDGQGFDSRDTSLRRTSSLGLISMRERAEMLHGALIVRSTPGVGTTITVQIPLEYTSEVLHGV
jgi:nitrate/nitrite-specific signal transduction histidine kinase